MDKILNAKQNFEKFVEYLEKLKELNFRLKDLEKQVVEVKNGEIEDDEKYADLENRIKEIEVTNKYIKENLDRSLSLIVKIIIFIISTLIAMLGAALAIVIKYLLKAS